MQIIRSNSIPEVYIRMGVGVVVLIVVLVLSVVVVDETGEIPPWNTGTGRKCARKPFFELLSSLLNLSVIF